MFLVALAVLGMLFTLWGILTRNCGLSMPALAGKVFSYIRRVELTARSGHTILEFLYRHKNHEAAVVPLLPYFDFSKISKIIGSIGKNSLYSLGLPTINTVRRYPASSSSMNFCSWYR